MAKKKQVIQTQARQKAGTHPVREKELKNHKLGSGVEYPTDYDPNLLESIVNLHPKNPAWSSFVCTEFTSLCPKTAQPDFAKIYINYIADKKMVESKSLKLYLFSFRNHGDFHEDCIQIICRDLFQLLAPHYLEVIGEFTPRGGIAIFPYASLAKGKKYQQIKDQRMALYAPGKYSFPLQNLY